MSMTERNDFHPEWVSPPGDTIADLLDERGWTQAELAERTGYSTKFVNQLIRGKVSLTGDAALRLETVFGAPARFWMDREAQYREDLERENKFDRKPDRTPPYPRCPECGKAVVGAMMTSRSITHNDEVYYHPDAISVYCECG